MLTPTILQKELLVNGIFTDFLNEFSSNGKFSDSLAINPERPGWYFDVINNRIIYSARIFESDMMIHNWSVFTHNWNESQSGLNGDFAKKLWQIFNAAGYKTVKEEFNNYLGKLKFSR